MKEQANTTLRTIVNQLQYSDNFYESVDESLIADGMLVYIEDIDNNIVYTYPDNDVQVRIDRDNSMYVTATEKFLSTNSN